MNGNGNTDFFASLAFFSLGKDTDFLLIFFFSRLKFSRPSSLIASSALKPYFKPHSFMQRLASSFDTFSNVFVSNSVTSTLALKLVALKPLSTFNTADILTYYFYFALLLSFTFITFLPSFYYHLHFFNFFFFTLYFTTT